MVALGVAVAVLLLSWLLSWRKAETRQISASDWRRRMRRQHLGRKW